MKILKNTFYKIIYNRITKILKNIFKSKINPKFLNLLLNYKILLQIIIEINN